MTTADDTGGLFRSDDSGESWERVNEERKIQVRAWYYTHLEADPRTRRPSTRSACASGARIDGGRTFERLSTPHGDNHDLWINPGRPEVMIEANDGGATVTLDGGETWSTLHNQPTAELYRLTVDERFPYRLYGAQQDNTSISVPAWSAGGISAEQEWWMAGGGESGDIAVHPDRPDVIYSGNYIGLIERWDRASGDRRGVMVYPELADGVPPRDLRYRFQWNAPIRLSPHDPDTLYQASHRLHRSRDGGASWETMTDDLTHDDDETSRSCPAARSSTTTPGSRSTATIFAFEESPLEPGVLWAGTDDGRLHVSRDDGATWVEVTPPGLPVDTTINSIEISTPRAGAGVLRRPPVPRRRRPAVRHADRRLRRQLVLSGRTGCRRTSPSAWFGRTRSARGLLFAGTERGVQVSFDDGATLAAAAAQSAHRPSVRPRRPPRRSGARDARQVVLGARRHRAAAPDARLGPGCTGASLCPGARLPCAGRRPLRERLPSPTPGGPGLS